MIEDSDTYSVADLAPFQPEEEIAPFDGHPDMHDKEGLETLESPITSRYVDDSSIESGNITETFEDAREIPTLSPSNETSLDIIENVTSGFVHASPCDEDDDGSVYDQEMSVKEISHALRSAASLEDLNDTLEDTDDFTIPPLKSYLSPNKGKNADYDTFSVREARVVAIPPIVNARTIVKLIPTEFPVTPQPPSSNPYVHVYTSKSAAVDIPNPLFDPIRKHKKSQSSPFPASSIPETPPSPSASFTPRMMSSKPLNRPPTSYSWLGKMFEPIGPEIVEAEQQGWIDEPDEPVDELPSRKLSQRLRRRIFPHREHEIIPEFVCLSNMGLTLG
jgi:hypothetical protein